MLTDVQKVRYSEQGLLAIEDVLPATDVAEAGTVVEQFTERSREVTESEPVYDLEPGHRSEDPRVRRLKEPCALHPVFRRLDKCDAAFNARIVRGTPADRYRVREMEVSIPLSKPERQGSIYEIQAAFQSARR